ncbi:MAG: hypothetical protein EAZ95_19230, partial [Bacteroidetes bacterium]
MYQLLLFFFFLLPALVSAQKIGKPFVQAYPARVYGSAVQNWGIGQDKRGIMYFANDQGVLEYDGRDWRLFVLPHYEPVRSIRVSEENTVYVGGVGEFGYLSPNAVGSLEFVSLKPFLPSSVRFEDVWSIQATPDMVYFQTDSYIFGYEPHTQKPLKIWNLPAVDSDFFLTFLVHKKLFVHSRKSGLFVLEKGKFMLSNAGATFAGSRIYTMLPFSPTKIVIGTREEGLFLLDYSPTGKVSVEKWDCEANTFLLKNQLYSGNTLPQNRIVLCTRRAGAIVIDHYGKIVEVFDKKAGLTDENVRATFLSNDNILWFALNNGINHVSYYSPIRLWDDTRGIDGTIHDIHEFLGQTYLATDLGLFVLNKTTDKFEALQGVSNIEAWTFEIFKTSYGTEKLLAGTNDGVVEIQNNTAFSILSSKKAIRSLKQSIHLPECVYVGQKSGLLRLKYTQASWVLDAHFEQVNQDIISLLETPSKPQELWIGTFTDGVYKILIEKDTPKVRLKPYRLSEGLPAMRDSRLYAWKGEMLVACMEGLFVYDAQQDRFAISPMWAKRFPNEKRGVYSLTTDNQQNLWLADHDTRKHSIGAFRVQKNNEYEWQEGIMKRLPEFSESKLYVDNQKTIWVGGTDGLYRY